METVAEPNKRERSWVPERITFLVLLFAFTTFFVHNAALQPDIMECRNLITAHEMATEGNWLLPTMNGDLRLEKPPLPTWVAGVIEKVVPGDIHTQRSAAAVMALVWVVFFWLFVRRTTGDERLANVASLMMMTCYNVVLAGRTASWDVYCYAFSMAAIYFLYCALYEWEHHRANFFWAGLFMGLSLMSKGPVGIYSMLLPFLVATLVMRRPTMRGKWLSFAMMLVVAAVVGGWWYVYVLMARPEAARAIFGNAVEAVAKYNVRPWYYYWRFFLEVGIWAPLMIISIFVALRTAVRRRFRRGALFSMATIWALLGVVLMSFIPDKAPRYLVPLMPACCLMMTSVLAMMYRPIKGFMLVYLVAVFFAAVEIFALPYLPEIMGTADRKQLDEIRKEERLKPLPWYYVVSPDHNFRIETVYEANHKIKPVPEKAMASLGRPCVVLVSEQVGDSIRRLPQRDSLKIEHIGRYDDNRHPESDKHYRQSLISHVLLMK